MIGVCLATSDPPQTTSKVDIGAEMIEKRVVCPDESGASGGPDAPQGRARGRKLVGDADAVFGRRKMLRDEFEGEGRVGLVRKVGDVGVLRCLVVWVGGIGRRGVRLLLGVRDESVSRRSVDRVGDIGRGGVRLLLGIRDEGVSRRSVGRVGGIGSDGVRLLLGVGDESVSGRSVSRVGDIGRDGEGLVSRVGDIGRGGGGLVRARFGGGCIDGKGRHSRGSSRCLDLFEFPGSRSGFIVIFARASFFCSFDLI